MLPGAPYLGTAQLGGGLDMQTWAAVGVEGVAESSGVGEVEPRRPARRTEEGVEVEHDAAAVVGVREQVALLQEQEVPRKWGSGWPVGEAVQGLALGQVVVVEG